MCGGENEMRSNSSVVAKMLLGANVVLALIVIGVVWMLATKNLSNDVAVSTTQMTNSDQKTSIVLR